MRCYTMCDEIFPQILEGVKGADMLFILKTGWNSLPQECNILFCLIWPIFQIVVSRVSLIQLGISCQPSSITDVGSHDASGKERLIFLKTHFLISSFFQWFPCAILYTFIKSPKPLDMKWNIAKCCSTPMYTLRSHCSFSHWSTCAVMST